MEKDHHVVGIGASAGGLQSLSEFFNTLDATLPFAIVLITHLHTDYRSKLDEILRSKTGMKVQRLESDTAIKKGVIYVLAAHLCVTIKNAVLYVRDSGAESSNAIDIFLESLADDFKEKAIGIILSGTGKDGVAGVKKISENGGLVLVQEPFSALYQSLPRLVVKDDHPDKVLPAVRLATWLNRNFGTVSKDNSKVRD